jgi:purine-binding chemotaxis protein CheW
MGHTEKTKNTCIIVVEFMLNNELFVVGILADAVLEVFELEPKNIEPPPKFGVKLSTHYIRGMGKRGDKMFIILVAEKIFSEAELNETQDASATPPLTEVEVGKPMESL